MLAWESLRFFLSLKSYFYFFLTRTGRIGLHENDDPNLVAYNFSRAFQLNSEMKKSLEELLQCQLETYLKSQETN